MDDVISRQALLDEMKDMYRAAKKWKEEATTDYVKARAESCMDTLLEMKLRAEKMPSAQGGKTMTVKELIEELEIQHEAWGKQYTFDMILRDIEKYAEEEDHEKDTGDR